MRRIEGFIDIDRMLRKGELRKAEDFTDFDYIPSNMSICIDKNNEIYFFKVLTVGNPYSELLAEELLKDLGLPHAEYDLAIYGKNKGVITKNFRKKSKKYITGEVILKDYLRSLGMDTEEIALSDFNNLETIWNALEYRYRNNPNKVMIVERLMNQLVNLFIFDIMIENFDRYYKNYQIEEGEDDINLAPIFDNETIGSNYRKVSLRVNNDRNSDNSYDELSNFISMSKFETRDLLKEKMEIISGENIDQALYKIERKTGYPIPDGIAVEYIKEFMNQSERIERILNKYTKGDIYER